MLTVILATSTAALFGVGDFLGGFASRRASAMSVTAIAHGLGVLVFATCLVLFRAPFDARSVMAGASAGISGGIGVASLYAALGRGRMSVIAPLTAAISGSLPAAYDFARGSRIPPTAIAGLVLAMAATIIVSANSAAEDGEQVGLPGSAIALGVVAGFGFAGSFISFSFAGDTSGFWPLLAARATSFSLLVFAVLATRRKVSVPADAVRPTLGAGLLDTAANITMLAAIRLGPLSVASVIGSLYPVVTVLLARVVLHERIRGWQRLGVALALAAVILAAMPWPLG